jgi:hypothetical protein
MTPLRLQQRSQRMNLLIKLSYLGVKIFHFIIQPGHLGRLPDNDSDQIERGLPSDFTLEPVADNEPQGLTLNRMHPFASSY